MVIIKNSKPIFDELDLLETLNYIDELACTFAEQVGILKELEITYSSQVNELLSSQTFVRYKSNAKALKYPYKNYLAQKEAVELNEGFLIQSWSSMGSILESTLQMFLAFYYRDYIKSDTNIWRDEVITKIKHIIKNDWNKHLQALVMDSEVNFKGKDRVSFLKKIDKIIEDKKLPAIEKMTLEPLIAFYFSNEIIVPKEYSDEELRRIRDYRNSIHSFQKREIGGWKELNQYGKVLLMFLIDMYNRLPDVPDEVPLTIERYDAQRKISMLEHQWFEYDYH